MANYNNYSTGMGWKILSLFLALVIVAGVIAGVVFWQMGNIEFHPIGQEQEETTDNGGAIIGEGESDGVSVKSMKIPAAEFADYGISPLAETAYKLTATVTGSDGTTGTVSQSVNFSAAWENASSAWANGKNISEYLTVEKTGENTATVTCLKAFGEQINVTAVSVLDNEKKGVCIVDYVKRVESISFSGLNFSFMDQPIDYKDFEATVEYGDGTLQGEVFYTGYAIKAKDGLTEKVKASKYYTLWEDACEKVSISPDFTLSYELEGFELSKPPRTMQQYSTEYIFVDENANLSGDLSAARLYFWYAMKEAFEANSGDVTFSISWVYKYDEEEVASGTSDASKYYDVAFNFSYPSVSDVALDIPNIIF